MRPFARSAAVPRLARRLMIAMLVVSSASSCAPHASAQPADDADLATLNIINHHMLDVVIYNVRQGHHERIGDVTAASKGSFALHMRRFPGNELQLSADPVGSTQPVTTQVLHVLPGETIEWTLESDLARSFVVIR